MLACGVEQDGDRAIVDALHLHFRAEDAGFNLKSPLTAKADDHFIEGNGLFGSGGLGEAGAAGAAIGEEGELADYQKLGKARISGIYIHFSSLVMENTQAANFVGNFLGLGLGIVGVDAQKHQKALAYCAVDLAVNGDRGRINAGEYSTH